MAKFKEIEIKWSADHVSRRNFNKKLRSFLTEKKYLYDFVQASGPDTYFANSEGGTIRHRKSKDTHELTSKLRIHKNSIRTRKEVNVRLAVDQPIEDVFELLGMIKLKKNVAITKDCDIYFIKGSKAHVSIVWYVVHCVNRPDRTFAEVEVEGLSHGKSLKVLNMWVKRLENMFGFSEADVSDKSLYEIYSGKRYRRVRSKS